MYKLYKLKVQRWINFICVFSLYIMKNVLHHPPTSHVLQTRSTAYYETNINIYTQYQEFTVLWILLRWFTSKYIKHTLTISCPEDWLHSTAFSDEYRKLWVCLLDANIVLLNEIPEPQNTTYYGTLNLKHAIDFKAYSEFQTGCYHLKYLQHFNWTPIMIDWVGFNVPLSTL